MHAVPMVAVDPLYDALHLGGLLAVLAGSAALYWLVTSLSKRSRNLTPSLQMVLLGAVAIAAGYFLPWAQVAARHFSSSLFGGDFAGAFGAAVLSAIAVVIFLAAALTPVWESNTLRIGLGAVLLGAGVGAGLLGLELLRPDHQQIVATFVQQGPSALARVRHIPLADAQHVIDRIVTGGSFRAESSFGPYVVVGGAVLVAVTATFNLIHQLGQALEGRRHRGWSTGQSAEGGPLARGHAASNRAPERLPGPRVSARSSRKTRVRARWAPVGPAALEDLPPAPPMPPDADHAAQQSGPHLDSSWSARSESRRRGRRLRAR